MAESPRVLIVMPEQWPRALLRAALREGGYDAVGTRSLTSAIRIQPTEVARGPVRLIIVDQGALRDAKGEMMARLIAQHGKPKVILVRRALESPIATWDRVLTRPVSVADIVAAVQEMLPLPRERQRPLD